VSSRPRQPSDSIRAPASPLGSRRDEEVVADLEAVDVDVVREMARCLLDLAEGRAPN